MSYPMPDHELWKDGLICAFELINGQHWVEIGWYRIGQLLSITAANINKSAEIYSSVDDEGNFTEAPGPVWWCHLLAADVNIQSFFNTNIRWIHDDHRMALRDLNALIVRDEYLFHELPITSGGGFLFELDCYSIIDETKEEVPIVLRLLQQHNFMITTLHVIENIIEMNVGGIVDVKKILSTGGKKAPKTVYEVTALLASRLSTWNDRSISKNLFNRVDESELKFMMRQKIKDVNIVCNLLAEPVKALSIQMFAAKLTLQRRNDFICNLLLYLKGSKAICLMNDIQLSTKEMLIQSETHRSRLFSLDEMIAITLQVYLQEKTLKVTHNIAVFTGVGLILSVIVGLFGINVDGIPGSTNAPHAFSIFAAVLFGITILLVAFSLHYFGMRAPVAQHLIDVRKFELHHGVNLIRRSSSHHPFSPMLRDLGCSGT